MWRANVRSRRSEIRKFASEEGTKQGLDKGAAGNNHQSPSLTALVRPTAHELSRAGFPPPLTLPCCGTHLQGGNGVDVHGGSSEPGIPPTVVISAPGFLVGSGMDPELRGFLHAEPGANDAMMAHTGALILRFRRGCLLEEGYAMSAARHFALR